MDLRTLRPFLAVAREGNVTRAARQLHITQPGLSRQLSELERVVGDNVGIFNDYCELASMSMISYAFWQE
ncbi:MAG: LysR family transcriptional regulator [Atopobiaceae bacterium]|nr:LysR family transcriptional regulator [Atopobiaceae bacterium]